MNNLDDNIKEALSQESNDIPYRFGDEESLRERVAGAFHSRSRWLIVIAWFAVAAASVFAFLCAIWFFRVESTRAQILFATLFLFWSLAVSLLKLWYYMEMNKNTHTREIKRLELQIARLGERLK